MHSKISCAWQKKNKKTRNIWDVIDDHNNNFPGENMGKLVAFSKQYLQLFDATSEHPSTMSIKKICTSH
jgi:hypothetical protein